MKVYGLLVLAIVYVVASVGFILPFLISAASTSLVVAGIVYMCSMPLILYKIYGIVKSILTKETEIGNS